MIIIARASQKFCNILIVRASVRCVYYVTKPIKVLLGYLVPNPVYTHI